MISTREKMEHFLDQKLWIVKDERRIELLLLAHVNCSMISGLPPATLNLKPTICSSQTDSKYLFEGNCCLILTGQWTHVIKTLISCWSSTLCSWHISTPYQQTARNIQQLINCTAIANILKYQKEVFSSLFNSLSLLSWKRYVMWYFTPLGLSLTYHHLFRQIFHT